MDTILQMLDLNSRLSFHPRRVVSIVSPSRSGSTVFKYALCLHPELCSIAGEEEPYYKLTHHGYPAHRDDEFHYLNNQHAADTIRLLIANEIHNHASGLNRKILQENGVEEPPFVDAIECRQTDTLVLKTPQNCYRRGVIQELYPDAVINYITVSRAPRATINGLMDGWESPHMFTSRQTERGWWKFDMPPDWSWDRSVIQRCIHQWESARRHILLDYRDAIYNVVFEQFEDDWQSVCRVVWEILGLREFDPPRIRLPLLCSTDQPRRERWMDKRPWLEELELPNI